MGRISNSSTIRVNENLGSCNENFSEDLDSLKMCSELLCSMHYILKDLLLAFLL